VMMCGMNYIGDHFFQDIETDVFGKITSFKMHDLAQSISEEVCCSTINDDLPSTLERIRHLSIDNGTVSQKQNDSGISSCRFFEDLHKIIRC
jgi:hypothetical protein